MAKTKITMQKIADVFNVSKVTVSKALNGKDGVGTELKEKIIAKAQEYGYTVPILNNTKKGHHIAIFCAAKFLEKVDEYNFYPNIYQKISTELTRQNSIGTLIPIANKADYSDIKELLGLHDFEGIITLGKFKEEFLSKLREIKLPKVYVDTNDSKSATPTILFENIYSICEATEHLINMGHTKIGFIGSINVTKSIMDRYLGFLRAMMLHKLEIKSEWIIEDRNSENEKIDIKFPDMLPTAFVCNCDDTAYRAVKRLQEKGIIVPDNVSIVSFDNDIFSKLSEPKLTTIAPDIGYVAKKSVKLIIDQINTPDKKIPTPILVNGKIIYRDSVKKLV